MDLCNFSRFCVVGSPGVRPAVLRERLHANRDPLPVFWEPRVFAVSVWRGHDVSEDGTRQRQTWYPWQFCSNCRAARSLGHCGHWHRGFQRPQVLQLPANEHSALERAYPPEETDRATNGWLAEEED